MVHFLRKEDERSSVNHICKMLDSLPFTNEHHILRVFPNDVVQVRPDKFGVLVFIELDDKLADGKFINKLKKPKL